jgi:hypothetical protein
MLTDNRPTVTAVRKSAGSCLIATAAEYLQEPDSCPPESEQHVSYFDLN